ncbi:MAG: hypothetical protein ACE5J2_03565 [Nitrososphaerales archaeon]
MQLQTDFEQVLNRIIDESIKGAIGQSSALGIYYHLKDYGVNSDRLGEDPAALEKAMVEIFKVGWSVFEKAILSSLSKQLGLSEERFAHHSFVECINLARSEFSSRS